MQQKPILVTTTVNGRRVSAAVAPNRTLLEFLRYDLGLIGTKQGCDKGDCGACTLLVDGRAVLSCLTLLAEVEGRAVTTVEGLVGRDGPDVVQDSFDEAGALQCGFCQPGMIMAARQLVTENPRASLDDVRDALASNLCRCTGYTKIFDAVQMACRRELARRGGGGTARAAAPAG